MERSSENSPSRGARAFGQVAAMGSGAENGYEYEAPGVAVDAGELQKAREWLQPPLLWAPSRGARQLFRRGRQSRPRGVQPPLLSFHFAVRIRPGFHHPLAETLRRPRVQIRCREG